MKKTLLVFASIIIFIMVILFVFLKDAEGIQRAAKRFNFSYEQYLEKEIYGIDIGTLINKAIADNEANGIQKDENGSYIENNTNSIKIDIYINLNDTTYPMETIYKAGTSEFIKNFGNVAFIGKVQKYHKTTGQIAKILFEQK